MCECVLDDKIDPGRTVVETACFIFSFCDFAPDALALLEHLKDPQWKAGLSLEVAKPYFNEIGSFLAKEYDRGAEIFPPRELIFNAFNLTPLDQVSEDQLRNDILWHTRTPPSAIPGSNYYVNMGGLVGRAAKVLHKGSKGPCTKGLFSLCVEMMSYLCDKIPSSFSLFQAIIVCGTMFIIPVGFPRDLIPGDI